MVMKVWAAPWGQPATGSGGFAGMPALEPLTK